MSYGNPLHGLDSRGEPVGPAEPEVLSEATLAAVAAEALRAHLKHKDAGGSLLDITMSVDRRLAALGEEFGEVCRALTYDGGQGVEHLIKELTQTASVALTWVEALRRWGEAS